MDDLISQASVQICSDGTFHITTTKIRRCHIDAVSCTEFAWMCIYNHLHAYTTWGFLKMNDPQVTMGFNSKMVELDDLGYDSNRWAVAPAGDFSANRAMPLAAVSALLLAPWLKTEVYMELTLVSRWSYHVRSITFLCILMGESYPSVWIFIFPHFLHFPYFL